MCFTGYAVLVLPPASRNLSLDDLGIDGFGGASSPRVVTALARGGWVDTLDVLLVRHGAAAPETLVANSATSASHTSPVGAAEVDATDRGSLVLRPDLRDHPRARRARDLRTDVAVLGWPELVRGDVVTLGRGIGGLLELSVESTDVGVGSGQRLVEAALRTVPAERVVVAAAAPGNARSLRMLLRAGFAPVGSVQLFLPR